MEPTANKNKQWLASDVVEAEAKRGAQRSQHSQGIQSDRFCIAKTDCQSASAHCQQHRNRAQPGRPLLSGRDHVNQHPGRSGILNDDRGRHRGSLNRVVVEEIRSCQSQHSDRHAAPCFNWGDPETLLPPNEGNKDEKNEKREGSAGLGDHQR